MHLSGEDCVIVHHVAHHGHKWDAPEVVGENGNQHAWRGIDRQTGRNLGIARIVAPTWQVGAAKKGKGRE